MKTYLFTCIALLTAAPALAQDQEDILALESCLAKSAQSERCIGALAEHCVETLPGGYSTVAMKGCLHSELSYWDTRLNASYKRLRKAGGEHNPDALRDMQRAWIAFRDGKCGYETALWGDGTGGGIAWGGCMMDETGRQALFLENLENY